MDPENARLGEKSANTVSDLLKISKNLSLTT